MLPMGTREGSRVGSPSWNQGWFICPRGRVIAKGPEREGSPAPLHTTDQGSPAASGICHQAPVGVSSGKGWDAMIWEHSAISQLLEETIQYCATAPQSRAKLGGVRSHSGLGNKLGYNWDLGPGRHSIWAE